MPNTQTAQSHTAIDPLFHYILAPLVLANFIFAIYETIHGWPVQRHLHFGWILIALILLLVWAKLRMYSIAVQDRVIRLEERVRIAALVSSADVNALSTRQLIALRFASDTELPALVTRTLAENLDAKAIKASIVTWRPDYARI